MARLETIYSNETSEVKAEYFEKVFVRINKENVDFVQRLAW